jgi:hypothetical protein
MQFTISLDTQSTLKLSDIQTQTNQDVDTIISQGIGLYHQQIQLHSRIASELDVQNDVVGEEYLCERKVEINWHHPSFGTASV